MVYRIKEKVWDAKLYKSGAGFVAELGEKLIEILNPKSNEYILDLGCGDGRLTKKIVEYSNCKVLGIDSSQNLIDSAISIGVDAILKDARNLDYNNRFDAVFSNAALHWMDPLPVVMGNIYRSLKTKGRFIAECGGANNIIIIRKELMKLCKQFNISYKEKNPWVFLTSGKWKQILNGTGFKVFDFSHFNRPTPVNQDIDGWLTNFCDVFYSSLSLSDQKQFIKLLRNALEPKLYNSLYSKNKGWYIDYTRIRFNAVKNIS